MSTFTITQFQTTLKAAGKKEAWSEADLHPKLVEFIADLRSMGVAVVVAEGNRKQDGSPSRNQCILNGVFLGYYKGSWGEYPWQVGPARDCCAREVALSLFAGKDVNESSFSKTARDFAEVEEMKAKAESKAKAEAPKAVQAPIAAIQAPVVEVPKAAPSLDVTAITVAALQAGKTTDEVLAIIAALKA